ncbi:MAG: hypothetical protein AABX94_00340 [Nanoarchaeota archaeon]
MNHVFEVVDKTGRKIRLANYAWKHIMRKHPMMVGYVEVFENHIL